MDIRTTLEHAVNRHPEKTALVQTGTGFRYSYRELWKEIKSIDSGLRQEFDLEKDTTAIFSTNEPEFMLTVFANWYAGRPNVSFNHRSEPGRIPYYLDDSDAEVLVFNEEMRPKVEEVRDELDVQGYVYIGDDAPDYALEFSELQSREPADNPDEVNGDDTAFIGYTSGTTGLPKGVRFTHSMFLHDAFIQLVEPDGTAYMDFSDTELECLDEKYRSKDRRTGGLTDEEFIDVFENPGLGERQMMSRQMFHTPIWTQSLASIMADMEMVLPESTDPEDILRSIEASSANLMDAVPTMYKMLAENSDDYDVSSLSYLHTGGGILTEEVMELIKDRLCENLVQEYASSEAYEICYSRSDNTSIGRTTCFQEVRIVEPGEQDPEKEVEQGEKGELAVRLGSPTTFEGYLGKPEKTREAVVDGWYFSGDIVRQDESGEFWFEGRADDMIISGGELIGPGEVENTILGHEKVENVGVIGVPDEKWGEKVVAYIQAPEDLDEEEIDRHCRNSELENYKRPKEYVFKQELPLNNTGGVQRRELREMWKDSSG